jgi:hypothetical protein
MRRKVKKHEPVDDLIDELVNMRRAAKKKVAKRAGNGSKAHKATTRKTKTRKSKTRKSKARKSKAGPRR